MDLWVPGSRFARPREGGLPVAQIEELWRHPLARMIRVDPDGHVFAVDAEGTGLRLVKPDGPLDPDRHFLLGMVGEQPWFVTVVASQGPVVGLRTLAAYVDDTDRDLATTAVALTNWHRVAPHCGVCGGLTEVRQGGFVRYCPTCNRERYPRTDPAVIVAIVDDTERLLLAHQAGWPDNRASILAGFVESGESLEQAVRREVFEEAGVRLGGVRYQGSQPHPFPRSLMVGFVARSLDTELVVDHAELEWAAWLSRDEVTHRLADGSLTLPVQSSIASHLVQLWLAGELPDPD